jgi:hypothetical protein
MTITSKPYSEHGRDEHDRIFYQTKELTADSKKQGYRTKEKEKKDVSENPS